MLVYIDKLYICIFYLQYYFVSDDLSWRLSNVVGFRILRFEGKNLDHYPDLTREELYVTLALTLLLCLPIVVKTAKQKRFTGTDNFEFGS